MKKLKITATITAILGVLGIFSTGYLYAIYLGINLIPEDPEMKKILLIVSLGILGALVISTLITMIILFRYMRKSDRILNMPLVSDINK